MQLLIAYDRIPKLVKRLDRSGRAIFGGDAIAIF